MPFPAVLLFSASGRGGPASNALPGKQITSAGTNCATRYGTADAIRGGRTSGRADTGADQRASGCTASGDAQRKNCNYEDGCGLFQHDLSFGTHFAFSCTSRQWPTSIRYNPTTAAKFQWRRTLCGRSASAAVPFAPQNDCGIATLHFVRPEQAREWIGSNWLHVSIG